MIQDHPVFGPKQASVAQQLGVALRQFGSAMDTAQIGQIFGIGDGTVSLYTHRVCTALMRSWRDAVRWPTEEEQMKMKLHLQAHSFWQVFEDCISILNSTLIPFAEKPGIPMNIMVDYFNHWK